MHKIRFPPQTPVESFQRFPDPVAVFKWAYILLRGGRGRGGKRGGEEEKKGRRMEEEGKGGV